MNEFEKNYKDLLKLAAYCQRNSKEKISSEEVVSEAYLLCEKDVSIENIKKNISFYCSKHKFDNVVNSGIHSFDNITDRQCTVCRDVLPNGFFNLIDDHKWNFTYYRNYCKKCEQVKRNILARIRYKQSEKIKNDARIRAKQYWEREKNKLSDKYIYHRLLRRRFKKEEITPQMVDDKRKKIMFKKNNLLFPQ